MKICVSLLMLCAALFVDATRANAQWEDHKGNFNIDQVMAAFNQMETLSSNLKALAAQTMPADYNDKPVLKKAWNEQTKFIERLRTPLVKTIAARTETVDNDETITIHEREKIVAQFSALQEAIQNENRLRNPSFNCNRAGSPEALCAREAGSGNATGVLMETVTVYFPSTSQH